MSSVIPKAYPNKMIINRTKGKPTLKCRYTFQIKPLNPKRKFDWRINGSIASIEMYMAMLGIPIYNPQTNLYIMLNRPENT